MSDPSSAPRIPRLSGIPSFLRRHWILTALLGLALVVRVALPEVLRRVVEAQASAALRARVELGDVDLWLLWGGVALEDAAVRAPEGGEPLLAWKQLYVRLSWLDLLRRTVLLRQVLLVEPRVDLERLADGGTNFGRILPESTPQQGEEPAPEGEPWRFALEELRLQSGRIDFEDGFVKASRPFRVEVQDLAVNGGGFATAFEGRVEIAAKLLIEDAPLEIAATVEPGPAPLGIKLAARVEGEGLPIDHGLAYSPYHWEDLRGRLDARLEWELDGARSSGRGRVALRDVEVRSRDADVAGASWSALEVEVDSLDLDGREARVSRIQWVKPRVVLEPGEPIPLPVLRSVVREAIVAPAAAAAGAEAAVPTPAGAPAPEETPAPAETPPPAEKAAPAPDRPASPDRGAAAGDDTRWRWSVGALTIDGMRVISRALDLRTELGLSLTVEDLADPSERAASFELAVEPAAGRIDAKGEARIAPLEIRTDLEWRELDLPTLLATIPRPELAALRSARSSGRLRIESVDDGGLKGSGALSLAEVSYGDGIPSLPDVGWQRLEASIETVSLPGVLSGAAGAPSVELGSLELAGAKVGVAREVAEAPAGDAATEPAPEVAAAKPGPADAGPAPRPDEDPGSAAAPRVRVRDLAVSDSELAFTDRTLGAPVRAEITAVDLRAQGIAWPGSRPVESLALRMEGPAGAKVRLEGKGGDDGSAFALAVEGLELVPFDAYARHFGGLTVDGGTADLETSVDLSADRYESESHLVLHDLGLSGDEGEASFEERFGVPLGLALALLRDVQGDIALDLPLSGGRGGSGVGVGKVLTRTLRRVLVNALASPLKLIGSVALAGGAIGKFAVEPVPFLPGTSELAPEAEERVVSLASMLAERPELAFRLEGRIAAADLGHLRQQELPRLLANPKSRASKVLRALEAQDEARAEAVQELLERRAGTPAETSPTPDLEKLLAVVEVPRDRLIALGLDRAERVRKGILANPSVAPEQVVVRTGTAEVRAKQPRVIVKLDARAGGGSSAEKVAPPVAR